MTIDKITIKRRLQAAIREGKELGGWSSFRKGDWLWALIQKSFRNYWERGTAEYFRSKYGTSDPEILVRKLISVAARNAAIVGSLTGAAISTDEIVTVFTAAEGGVGLPANLAIAATALSAEAILLVRIQLQLVANIGKAYGVPLDPDDPEDILTILAFALGGSAADAAGTAGMKLGGKIGGKTAKKIFSKATLAWVKKVGQAVGINILQRSIVKYTVPVVSIGIGTGWNYFATRTVGRIAVKHFKGRITG
jgi:uncharacterized protein (DUF697 family)